MEVIYLDNHLFAAVKPSGLATQPHDEDPDHFLGHAKAYIKEKYDKPGNVFLEPVHRLDKPVSGIVLFARTSKALSRLQAKMRDRDISKTYLALVEGKPPAQEGTLEHFLLHASHQAVIASPHHPEAKRAVLRYRVVEIHEKTTLLEIALETGRYHQIRVQFSAIGCPIVGDCKYGSRLPWKDGSIALHHAKMVFKHPVTGQELILENNIPLIKQKNQRRGPSRT
jgi:23S rRNA pseudouridine1911/1915/1917 synthase